MIHIAGLDIGQAQDYTALVIARCTGTQRILQYEAPHHILPQYKAPYQEPVEMRPIAKIEVIHIERFPLQTPYLQIAIDVEQRLHKIPTDCVLAVDRTGVGAGPLEMMARMNPIGIAITSGGTAQRVAERLFNVPKIDLVTATQVVFQQRILKVASQLPMADVLAKELGNFRYKITGAGNISAAAWRESIHDDLVLATAMLVWTANLVFEANEHVAMRRIDDQSDPPTYEMSPY